MKKIILAAVLMLVAVSVSDSPLDIFRDVDFSARLGQHWTTPELDELGEQSPSTFVAAKLNYPWSHRSPISVTGELKNYLDASSGEFREWGGEVSFGG